MVNRTVEKASDLAAIADVSKQPPQWEDSLAPILPSAGSMEWNVRSGNSPAHQETMFPVQSRPDECEWVTDESCREEVSNVCEEKKREYEGGKKKTSGNHREEI